MTNQTCTHLKQINPSISTDVVPEGCEECLETGAEWVHLRRCLVCGHVGCCDSSKNTHATKHFEETGHALMQSAEAGEAWRWCYIDESMIEDSKQRPSKK